MADILMIIAKRNFRDEEFFIPYNEFLKGGCNVVVASSQSGECSGNQGGVAMADISVGEANFQDFDAIIFVGGSGSLIYCDDEKLKTAVLKAVNSNKIIGAICIAPVILGTYGLLNGKRATVHESGIDRIVSVGANYTGDNVTADGKIVTADGFQSSQIFARKILSML